ncbi:MAG: alanine--tRNA ligase [Gemmataceae bacterium]
MIPSSQIRQQFIDFFCKKHGHTFVPSSSVVPLDDPTLLFSNAGMNQFKDVFLGTGSRPYKRAANTQKCIRAGGKHNDLDDVGKDTYHHTFFEMLGNWSFGDYFKKEAITWGWELLTDVWKLDTSRLHVTVFEGDDENHVPRDTEAAEHWRAVGVPPAHIHLGSKKDNFWEMGNTGPCGPCTEIHFDRTPDKSGSRLVNKGSPDVIEIWNLVFIQFNRNPDQSLTPLPAKHVDTGMGFERITAVIQGKTSNYDTDIFIPIFEKIQNITGFEAYTGFLDNWKDIAYRVIADHIRTLTFALADGAKIGNDGRDYVLKRILRRAARYGGQVFGQTEPFLHELVPTVIAIVGDVFPELKQNAHKVQELIREEELAFHRTLTRGLHYFNQLAKVMKEDHRKLITGKEAFTFHDTFGLYIDITEQMAQERGFTVDRAGFDEEMRRRKEIDRGARKKILVTAVQGELPKTDDSLRYGLLTTTATLLGWVKDNQVLTTGTLGEGDEAGLLLDRTNFYAEAGGQVGDSGTLSTATGTFEVEDTQRLGDAILHLGRVTSGTLEKGQAATLTVGGDRPHTMRNHTATHLLNWALREVLGDHVEQKGSLVDAEKTRFDFTHDKPLTGEEIAAIERLVNEKIYADLPVTAHVLPLDDAKKLPGLRAVFGEKYPDPVRVLLIGADTPAKASRADSIEFCGGTHLHHTGQAGFFKVVGQEGVAKGVRRLTGVTGRGAVQTVQKLAGALDGVAGALNCKPDEAAGRVAALLDEVKKLQTQLKKGAAGDLNSAGDGLLGQALEIHGAKVLVGEVPAAPIDQMRTQMDRLRQKAKSAVIVLAWVDEGKVGLMAAVTDDLTSKIEAGKLVGEVAKVCGGKGGGRKDLAQAGAPDAAKLPEALALAKKLAQEKLA